MTHPCDYAPGKCICRVAYGHKGCVFDLGDGHMRDCMGPHDASLKIREDAASVTAASADTPHEVTEKPNG